ncbi:Adipocyte plasma membrane-associated, partial [Brachionus plicatilis]
MNIRYYLIVLNPIQNYEELHGDLRLPDVVPLEGNLKSNTELEKTIYVGKGKLIGPECIAFDKDDFLYTGIVNGQIIRVNSKNLSDIAFVAQTGNQTQAFCEKKNSLEACGRPLGLRFRENDYENLYVADAFHGILKINVKTGIKTTVVDSKDKRFGKRPLKFTNDLDIDQDLIFFVDTSYVRSVDQGLLEYLEAQPRGRLFSYNEKTDQLDLLLENLFFPNGLQLMPDKNSILINENEMSRIVEFVLKGEKKGDVRVFSQTPGFGDTIRLTDNKTLIVPIAVARISKFYSILDFLGTWPSIRNFIGKIFDFGYLFFLFPKYGLLAEYDLKGNALNSWHDPSGKIVENIAT